MNLSEALQGLTNEALTTIFSADTHQLVLDLASERAALDNDREYDDEFGPYTVTATGLEVTQSRRDYHFGTDGELLDPGDAAETAALADDYIVQDASVLSRVYRTVLVTWDELRSTEVF